MNTYATNLVRAVQTRLQELGFYTDRIDGIAGKNTSNATIQFKRKHGLRARDYVGPLTLKALFADDAKSMADGSPPWIAEIRAHLGLHETRDNKELSAWLRSDGYTLGNPAKLPWCGDAVETAIRLTLPDEAIPKNPYLARNWLKFGIEVPLTLHAVCVFSRPGSSWSGHVGFVAGEDATHVHVLGGNQSNGITITRISKKRLLGCRWPVTYPLPAELGGDLPSVTTDGVSVNER